MDFPRLSFGIIVLNGEPFTKYCLRQIYPFAYEIIVVEGGSRKAVDEAPQGHSTDGTIEALWEFKETEDRENKLKIITRDGFWSEKDEQSQAYAKVATGDYLWQVDIDEFYTHSDMEKIRRLLGRHPEISGMSFQQTTFWGSPNFYCDNYFLRSFEYHRLFRWGKGFRYITHRPPTVYNDKGEDLRKLNWWNVQNTFSQGISLYHYSLLFPSQVMQKCSYYSKPTDITDKGFTAMASEWAQSCYQRLDHPYRVHNVHRYLSWLARYKGNHPEQIYCLWDDIKNGSLSVQTRNNDDVEQLFSKSSYKISVAFLNSWARILEKKPINTLWKLWNRLLCRLASKEYIIKYYLRN